MSDDDEAELETSKEYGCPFCGAVIQFDIAWGYNGKTLTERYRCDNCGSKCDRYIAKEAT